MRHCFAPAGGLRYSPRVRFPALVLVTTLLAACQSNAVRDPASPWYRIPAGSKLVLLKPVTIPPGSAHVKFQGGRALGAGGVGQHEVWCRLNVNGLSEQPRTVQPDSFTITRTSSDEDWVTLRVTKEYTRTLFLESGNQPGVRTLTCSVWDDPLYGTDISLPQIEHALGDHFRFELEAPPAAR
jgi:hypothetical protein